jgi:tubulin monoglycylase TTLL3/8
MKKKKKKRRPHELPSPYIPDVLPPVDFKSKKLLQTFNIFCDSDPSASLRTRGFARMTPVEERSKPTASSPALQGVKQPYYPIHAERLGQEHPRLAKDTRTPLAPRKSTTSQDQRIRQMKERARASRSRPTKEDELASPQPVNDKLSVLSSETQSMIMQEHNRRRRLHSQTRVFILNSQDDHIRRVLTSRGWAENTNLHSSAFNLKWTYSDTDADYKDLRPGQLFNHFANNRSLTTKSGLCRALRSVCTYGVNTDSFFPRCYDLGDLAQMEEFKQDYLRTAVLIVVQKHAALADQSSTVNRLCLKKAIGFVCRLLADIEDNCENKAKYVFMSAKAQSPPLSAEELEFLANYSKLNFPIDEAALDKTLYNRRWEAEYAWGEASLADLKHCQVLTDKLAIHFPQSFNDGLRNLWVIKPGQNSKGSGVMLTDSLEEVVERGLNMQSRVVQKYIERPLLLPTAKGAVKFDIRQWVLVTSFEPVKVFMFNSCYLRLCGQAYDLHSSDLLRHLTNFSLQKSGVKLQSETVWSLEQFMQYLAEEQPGITWQHTILPQVRQIVVDTITAVSGSIEHRAVSARQGCFELYGFDILLDEHCCPWLLEVNLSPACAERTDWLKEMLDAMAGSLFAIILDGDKGEEPEESPSYGWRKVHEEVVCHEAKTVNPHVVLEVVGERINPRKEKKLERQFFTSIAANVIQKVVRGFLVRNRRRSLLRTQAALKLQSWVRQLKARRRVSDLKIRRAVGVIRAAWGRIYAAVKVTELRVVEAVLTIQKQYRGHCARQALRSLRRRKAAVVILTSLKGMAARLTVKDLKHFYASVRHIQACWRRRLAVLSFQARRIQRAWRTHCKRRAFAVTLDKLRACGVMGDAVERGEVRRHFKLLRVYGSVVIIAAAGKTYVAFRLAQQLRQHKAATSIQRYSRRMMARRELGRLKDKQRRTVEAVASVQRLCRGYLERKRYYYQLQVSAATTIQSVFRGSLCRRLLAILKQRHFAAVKLQRFVRRKQQARRARLDREKLQQEIARIKLANKLRLEANQRILQVTERLSGVTPGKVRPVKPGSSEGLRPLVKPMTSERPPKLDLRTVPAHRRSEGKGVVAPPPKVQVGPVLRYAKEIPLESDALLEEIFIRKPRQSSKSQQAKKRSRLPTNLIFER